MNAAPPKGDPVDRAVAAYYRTGGSSVPHPSNNPAVVKHNGKQYVVLDNVNGVLAVYRIRNNGYLKQLKRWPPELEGR